MKKLRRYRKPIAVFLAALQLVPVFLPMNTFALTGGPSVPEVNQFSAAENTELVNLFTGNFNYQVPLLDVGGYPLTLSYSSNVGMETEASMVGLGWNINTGSISRDVRGLPDDFNGDKIQSYKYAKADEKIGFGVGLGLEITGQHIGGVKGRGGGEATVGLEATLKMEHSTYDGWSAGFGAGGSIKGESGGDFSTNGKLSVGIGTNSASGANINATVSGGFSNKLNENDDAITGGLSYGLAVNSRVGVKEQSFGANISHKNEQLYGRPRTGGVFANDGIGIGSGTFKGGGKFNVGYSSPSMTPTIGWPMYQDGFAGDLKLGAEIGGTVAITGNLEFKYSNQRYASNYEQVPSYGYLYAHNSSEGRETMDVLREKASGFSKEVPNLPMAQFAHDIYQVNVQGIQSAFRPFRSDVGTLFDPFTTSVNAEGGVGVDLGVGDLFKFGANIQVPVEYGQSGKWKDGNAFNTLTGFKKESSGNPLYEPVYFKSMGEATAMANKEQFANIGGFNAVRVTVDENGNTTSNMTTDGGQVFTPQPNYLAKQNREYRQNNFQWLTANDAQHIGFAKKIYSFPLNTFDAPATSTSFRSGKREFDRTDVEHKSSHISEVTVTRTDGTRFVFGVPAYNLNSTDVSFNISKLPTELKLRKDKGTGLVRYTPGVDNSKDNARGENHVYEKEITPASAYAWLLTDMLSADYVDLTGNGPSSDDLGSYTKFNYSRTNPRYAWRVPVQQDSAIFKGAVKSNEEDDMANYSYGEKELWYMHSIETKNYIAEFTYSDRNDAVGVLGQNGGLDTRQRMKKLDKIELYTKASRLESNAVPIKTVHFVYDYSLCGKVPNNIAGGGKLTLKRVWFQFGSSEKGSRNPYLFSYSNFNPEYHPKKFDRWGNYIAAGETEDGSDDGLKLYSALTKEKADTFSSAWLLNKITVPTGSVLNIEYETNDYAFVQNKRAMEFFEVKGFVKKEGRDAVFVADGEDTAALYSDDRQPNNYLQFKLKHPLTNPEDLRPYVEAIEDLYFSMNVRLNNPNRRDAITERDGELKPVFEKVEGFIPVQLATLGRDFGLCTGGNYAWIRLPQLHDGDKMRDMSSFDADTYIGTRLGVHPITKAAWETIRKKFMNLVYNEPIDPHAQEGLNRALENCFEVFAEYFEQANTYLEGRKHANVAKLKGAKIRLNTPDLVKFGGGTRVKKITISDEWGNMVQDPTLNFNYGKTYSYSKQETIDGTTKTISSGVAAYEPASGNEENPFVEPYRYVSEKPLSVDFNLYQTGPVGQIYFPSPVIGYSRVTVKDMYPTGAPATGYSVNEFFTARDFPTIVRHTDLQQRWRDIQVPPFYSEDHLNAVQGFTVELNDMHGNPKSTYMYPPDGTVPVSGSLYKYKTNPDNNSQLDNLTRTVDAATGDTIEELVGVDYDFFADAREHQHHAMQPSVAFNLDFRVPPPTPIPTVYPGYTHNFQRLRTATFNKVIYRCGLLEEVVSFDNGAEISARNLLRDRESGEVILKDIENEFADKQYALSYPARWIRENKGMNGAYRNSAVEIKRVTVNDGTATIPDAGKYFTQGDEIICVDTSALNPSSAGTTFGPTDVYKTAWVMNVNGNQVYLIDRDGNKFGTDTVDMRVLRSGYRNIINAGAAAFSLTTPPIAAEKIAVPASSDVLSAQVSEYSNHWQTYGLFKSRPPVYSCSCNHNQINKRNAVDLLGELVNTLLTRGDYKRNNISLSSSYSTGSSFFWPKFGSQSIIYNGRLSGSMARGVVNVYSSGDPGATCELDMRMENGISFFPDSILSFTIDSRTFNDGDGDCNDVCTATGTITYLGPLALSQSVIAGLMRQRLTARITITSCIPLANCNTVTAGRGEISCLPTGRTQINPFVAGVLGNWRPLNSWTYATNLTFTGSPRTGGAYGSFQNFFSDEFPLRTRFLGRSENWVHSQSLNVCDNFGRNIERTDALQNFNSQLYGYGFSLPVAQATNARYGNIAFDGFEDYWFHNQPNNPMDSCPLPQHFKVPLTSSDITSEYSLITNDAPGGSHTGKYCLAINTNTSVTRTYAEHHPRPLPLDLVTTSRIYNADERVIIPTFTPERNQDFFLSAWVKKSAPAASGTSNILGQLTRDILPGGTGLPFIGGGGSGSSSAVNSDIVVTASNGSTNTSIGNFKAEGNPVDGWYQINGKFKVPDDATSVKVEFRAVNGKAWFDDLRIQPFNSVMKTFVYDPVSLRLMAVLDENNYATFYVYDQQEQLIATKKETEDGIFTVQESRNGTSKITRP